MSLIPNTELGLNYCHSIQLWFCGMLFKMFYILENGDVGDEDNGEPANEWAPKLIENKCHDQNKS